MGITLPYSRTPAINFFLTNLNVISLLLMLMRLAFVKEVEVAIDRAVALYVVKKAGVHGG